MIQSPIHLIKEAVEKQNMRREEEGTVPIGGEELFSVEALGMGEEIMDGVAQCLPCTIEHSSV